MRFLKPLLAILVLFLPALFACGQAGKHALIIAVGNYKGDSTGWSPLGSGNDVPLLKDALTFQQFTDINILVDKQATKAGTVRALEDLIQQLSPGDVALIHISSHGQQVQDFDGDEPDGLDEAMVPYDAPCSQNYAFGYNRNYRGEKHLTDDEFAIYTRRIREKLGPAGDLVVFVDACYSGTFTKAIMVTRGSDSPLVLDGFFASGNRA